jgi:hypothetical protein
VRNWTGKTVIVTLVLGLLAVASPARAQEEEGILISAGVGLLTFDSGADALKGFAGNVSKAFKTLGPTFMLSVVGDVGRFADKGYTNLAYQGGLRVTASRPARVRVFGQLLAGMERTKYTDYKADNFVLTPGAGVDVPLNEVLRVRAQVDFPIVRYDSTTDIGRRLYIGFAFTIGGG